MDGWRNEIIPQDAEACRDLANYFEEHARQLRDHAHRLEVAELQDWRRTFKVWRSGKMARALVANGMPEAIAIKTTARRLNLERETVWAQYQFQEDRARQRARKRRDSEVRRLAKQGRSLREISERLGLSKSRIQQIVRK